MATKLAIVKYLENIYPTSQAIEGDTTGLEMEFDMDENIETVILTLDVTKKIIEYAKSENIKMIITHHPILYGGFEDALKNNELKQEIVRELKIQEITVLSMHTNIDVGKLGLSYRTMELLGLKPLGFIDDKTKLGALAYLDERKSLFGVIEMLMEHLNLKHVKYWKGIRDDFQRIAFVSGAGSSLIEEANKKNIELFITSDIPWHRNVEITMKEMTVVEVSHSIENIFSTIVRDLLLKNFPSLKSIIANVEDMSNTFSK